jgi:hypothetical protein
MVTQNIIPAGLNFPLPYKPTIATMDSAIKRWDDSMYAAKSYVGVTPPVFSATPPRQTIKVVGTGISIAVKDTLQGRAITIAADSTETSFKTGTMQYRSSSYTVVKVVENPKDETLFTLVALKPGKSTITVSAYPVEGVMLKKTFVVTVTAGGKRATGFSITLM